jgi:tRNA(Ile)-lysidine synthase
MRLSDPAPDGELLRAARDAIPGRDPGRIGVAVSGGSDSVAALHLLHAAGWTVEAVTVDHALRPEAAEEARRVAASCAGLGVPHATLGWSEGPDPTGNLMAQARMARYALIAGWARSRGLEDVVVAHTRDDVAETFLMRLSRGAGLDGLAAMQGAWVERGVTFRRPFLAFGREALRGYLRRHGVGWGDDPTNADPRYLRSRARTALAALAPLGIDAAGLAGVADRLASARAAIDRAVGEAAGRAVRLDRGDVLLGPGAPLHPEIGRRLVIAALRFVSGVAYPPREEALARLLAGLEDGRPHVLSGVRVQRQGEVTRFTREARAVAALDGPTTGVLDGRWALQGPHAPGLTVRALGAAGLGQCRGWRETGLPRASLLASPSVWQGPTLVAAPLAGVPEGWSAVLVPGRDRLPVG